MAAVRTTLINTKQSPPSFPGTVRPSCLLNILNIFTFCERFPDWTGPDGWFCSRANGVGTKPTSACWLAFLHQVLLDDPDNAPCREQHRRCRAVVKKVEAGVRLLDGGDVAGATAEWRAATLLEPDNPAFLGPLLLRVSPPVEVDSWGSAG